MISGRRGIIMILIALKQRTLWHQRRLDKKLDLFHSVRTYDDYRRLLERFLGFYEPVETALEATFNSSVFKFNFRQRKKTPLLVRDLHSMKVRNTEILPRCSIILTPRVDTLPRAFGCLYVFESATLNGQIVVRHLSHRLGLSPEFGGAFLNSYGNNVVGMWRDFGQQLKAYASQPALKEAVIRAAIDTFICMDQWMNGWLVDGNRSRGVEEVTGEKTMKIHRFN
jgi:heme oxygenase (biliverdin-IX-beta and delta-forming)